MMDIDRTGRWTATRLGVLGGSFNPIHLGHIHLAEYCKKIFGLSRVLFVVASLPPHKPARELISFNHRYAMVSLATSGRDDLIPSQVELEAPASPYSFENLGKLARGHGVDGSSVYFIAGGDSLLDVMGWHQSRLLLESYNFVFVMRPGVEIAEPVAALPAGCAERVVDARGLGPAAARERVSAAGSGRLIFLVDAGAPDIAASQVRRLAGAGEDIGHLVPASVNEYIQKLHPYGER